MNPFPPLAVVIPAAGVGSRMQANKAKQYLTINDKTILQHTLERFISLPYVDKIYVSISPEDELFGDLPISDHNKIIKVAGGKERADSVLNGLKQAAKDNITWCMVHDAARPCLLTQDVDNLYSTCLESNTAGILASPVRDTMKRSEADNNTIKKTVDRNNLWHALTPQCAPIKTLINAIEQQVEANGLVSKKITDEASALELAGEPVQLVEGSVKNIKVTLPEDLELAEFYLQGIKS